MFSRLCARPEVKTAEKDSKGLIGKLAAFAAFLVAVGALVDAVVALGSKSQPLVCSLGISLPWGFATLTGQLVRSLGLSRRAWRIVGTTRLTSCEWFLVQQSGEYGSIYQMT
jgi:hypothetical protein